MNIDCSKNEEVLVIRLTGELDADGVPKLVDIFQDGEGKDMCKFVVDLSELDYIDSSGLGAFVKQMKAARKSGGDVKLVSPSQEVRKVLELTRLDRIFDVRHTIEEAREQFYSVP